MVSIVFAGVGGQGVITVAMIIGKAAVMEERNALMTELHGMAQRGGRISVDVRIGDYRSAIIPIRSADLLVGFEELEAVRNLGKLRKDGIVILNRRRVHPVSMTIRKMDYPDDLIREQLEKFQVIDVDADGIAFKLGNKRVANTVMIGALHSTGVLGLREESIIRAIQGSLPDKLWEVNMKALEEGKKIVPLQAARTK